MLQLFPLCLLESNEAKYEDCIKIMDATEDDLVNLFTRAHGRSLLLEIHELGSIHFSNRPQCLIPLHLSIFVLHAKYLLLRL